jgi:hypothetical protein
MQRLCSLLHQPYFLKDEPEIESGKTEATLSRDGLKPYLWNDGTCGFRTSSIVPNKKPETFRLFASNGLLF